MDIVYIYRNHGPSELDKYLKNKGNLFIIGDNHVWFNWLKWFNLSNNMQTKQINAIMKILFACKRKEISENFLLMNDDFLFLEDTDINEIPLYSFGKFKKEFIKSKRGAYKQSLLNGIQIINRKDPQNFEVHYPIIINKTEFLKTFETIPWERKNTIYRSIYLNRLIRLSEPLKQRIQTISNDFKAYNIEDFRKMKENSFISTDNTVSQEKEYIEWLREKFPKKSIYETRVTGKV